MTIPRVAARRSVFLVMALMALTALVGGSRPAPAAPALPQPQAQLGEVTKLGPAIHTVNVRNVAYGELPDGRPVAYATSNGDTATFTVVDVRNGEQIHAVPLEGYSLGGFIEIADDGTVYFTARTGSYAGLFRFHPDRMELEQLPVDLAGQRVLYDGTFDDDGVLYFGTYPDAKLMAFDTESATLRDHGSLTDDAAYVFSVGIVDGEVWAGTGPVPHLYRIDPGTGTRTEMHPPEHVMDGTDWFIAIEPRGDKVFVRLSPRGRYDMAVYDRHEQRWLDDVVEGTFATAVTATGRGNKAYFMQGDVLTGYDLPAERTFTTGFEDSELRAALSGAVGTYGITLTDLDVRGFPGETVVGLSTDGDLWHFNLPTGRTNLVEADVLGSPAGAHSMGVGPDGTVYMGAYLSSGAMSRIDQGTQQIEQLRGPKQADAIIAHGGELVVSSYPGAVVHVGAAAADWDWHSYRQILELGRGEPNYQDRIFAMASVGDRLAVGSVPDYGQLGGALTIVDPATGDYEFHRGVVAEQSIVSLAHRDGLIYGGTSIHGGLSTEPSHSEAELFVWDVAAGERVFSAAVVPGAEVIDQLEFGPDGLLWGVASDGTVFAFDPAQRDVVKTIDTGLASSNAWGRRTSLYYREADSYFYGNAGGALFRFDPMTAQHEVLVDSGVHHSAMDGQGRIYYAGDVDVYRWQ